MPRRDRRQREFERREEDLLTIARDLLGSAEWRTFTMAQLAAAADVAKGTVYLHVPSRQALLARLAIRALRPIVASVRAAAETPGGTLTVLRRMLVAWLHATTALPPADRRAIRAVEVADELGDLPPDTRERLAVLDGEIDALLRSLLVRGVAEGLLPETRPIERQLATVRALLHGTRDQLWDGGHTPVEAEARLSEAVEFALVGLVGTRPEAPLED
jgi:AcrR family transcriptional regulator